jgi:site-specific recombinase XerD
MFSAPIRRRLLTNIDGNVASSAAEVVDYMMVIDDPSGWVKEKKIGKQGRRAMTLAMGRLFDFLKAGDTDMGRVTEANLIAYRAHLVASIRPVFGDNTADKELQSIKSLFRFAHENMRKLTSGNPAAKDQEPRCRVR